MTMPAAWKPLFSDLRFIKAHPIHSEIIKKAFMSKIIPYKDDGKKDIKIPEKTIARDKSPLPH